AAVHRLLGRVAVQRVALQVQPEQACRTDQQADAAGNAEQNWQAARCIRRMEAQQIVIERRHASCREAEYETVKGEMMKTPTHQGEGIVGVVTAHTMAAIEILQLQHVTGCLCPRLAADFARRDFTPELTYAESQRQHGKAENGAKH